MKQRNNITFKIATAGEGKTKWLLDLAEHYASRGINLYMFTTHEEQYKEFCDKYFYVFKNICPVIRLTNLNQVTSEDIVIIDNLFMHGDVRLNDVLEVCNNCYKMFITIEGVTA